MTTPIKQPCGNLDIDLFRIEHQAVEIKSDGTNRQLARCHSTLRGSN
jgi:hypothetical protein